jgi:DNA-binding response OmpR family regulator
MTNGRLLVIDDEPNFGKFVSRVASALGFDVEVTSCSEDFMAAVPRFQPDVIVLDIVMPKVDGIELIQWLASRGTKARVIVTSGFNPRYAEAAQILGAAAGILSIATLPKPVARADLETALMGEQEPPLPVGS